MNNKRSQEELIFSNDEVIRLSKYLSSKYEILAKQDDKIMKAYSESEDNEKCKDNNEDISHWHVNKID